MKRVYFFLLSLFGASLFTVFAFAQTGSIPVITSVRVENIYGTGVQIKWATDVPSTSRVMYGVSSGSYTLFSDFRCDDGGYVTAHCVNLTDLSPNTIYYFKLESTGSVGGTAYLDGLQFLSADSGGTSTPTSAPSAPTNLSGYVSSNGADVILTWVDNSSDEGEFKVFTDSGTGSGNYTYLTTISSNQTTFTYYSHPAGTYMYQVMACNTLGCSTSNIASVTRTSSSGTSTTTNSETPPPPPPPTSTETAIHPSISEVRTEYISGSGAQVKWVTDISSDSRVYYGTSASHLSLFSNSLCGGSGYVTNHCVNLTYLLPNTVYYYKVASMPSNGSEAQVSGFQFLSAGGETIMATSSGTGTATETSSYTTSTSTTGTSETNETITVEKYPRAYLGISSGTGTTHDGSEVRGEIKVGVQVKSAREVTFYVKSVKMSEPKMIGKAVRSAEGSAGWMFVWNTRSVSDDSYRLFSRISNEFGEYMGDSVTIFVRNGASREIAPPPSFQVNPQVQEHYNAESDYNTEAKKIPATVQISPTVFFTEETVRALPPVIEERVRTNYTDLARDTDSDGVSDYDEINIFKTSVNQSDTDSDGISDADEILNGTNPLVKNSSTESTASVQYENPKTSTSETPIAAPEVFTVEKLEVVEITKTAEGIDTASKISLTGKGLPNSFITLYIFSTPVVVTVKTDNDGNWKYVMDRELEDGKHEVYVAMTDAQGKILVKSDPIPFIKEASAVSLESDLVVASVDEGKSFFSGNTMFLLIFATLGIIALALLALGIVRRRGGDDMGGTPGAA